jgi:hypothetical protein
MSIGPNPNAEDLGSIAEVDESVEASEEEATQDQGEGIDQSESATEESEDSFTDFDRTQIPEEYREDVDKIYKRFQADYTRKTQALSGMRKEVEASRETVEMAREIVESPELERFLQLRNAGKLSGETTERDEIEDLREQADPTVAALVEKTVKKLIGEQTADLNAGMAKINAVIFAAQHQDWQTYHKDMQKIMRANPGMTLEDAYDRAKAPVTSAENVTLRRQVAELQSRLKKDGTVEKPGPPKPPVKSRRASSWEEARAMALAEHGEPNADDVLYGAEG